jgi:thioredoxin reductase
MGAKVTMLVRSENLERQKLWKHAFAKKILPSDTTEVLGDEQVVTGVSIK